MLVVHFSVVHRCRSRRFVLRVMDEKLPPELAIAYLERFIVQTPLTSRL
jgi:hypothetical protein